MRIIKPRNFRQRVSFDSADLRPISADFWNMNRPVDRSSTDLL